MTVFLGHKLAGLALGAAALVAIPSAASATNYNITSWGVDTSTPGDEMWGNIQFTGGPSGGENAWVSRLFLTGTNLTTNATQTLYTWCIDIFDNLQNGTFVQQNLNNLTTYTPTYSATKLTNLVKLVTNIDKFGASQITDATKSAAAQLAIWEVLNETGSTLDVTGGSFKASGGTLTSAVYTQANSWLSALPGMTSDATQEVVMINPNPNNYTLGSGNQAQIFVVAAHMPEPASWVTMILGFGTIGWATRRRRAVGRAVA